MPALELRGFHHVTLPVTDLDRSVAWYASAFGASHDPRLDHRDAAGERIAVVLRVPGLSSTVKLHLAGFEVSPVRGYDPITLAVSDDSALLDWAAHFSTSGITHDPVSSGRIGHVITLKDPDGTPLRLYSLDVPSDLNAPPAFSYRLARRIVDDALLRARTLDLPPMTVAVLDAGGKLVAFGREDGASLHREAIARAKAGGALGMGLGSRALAAKARSHPEFIQAVTTLTRGEMIPAPGGVLIRDRSSMIIGGVGVSGHLPDDDEDCAVHAIESVGLTPDTGEQPDHQPADLAADR